MAETACITGITGQTGHYLCDLLLKRLSGLWNETS